VLAEEDWMAPLRPIGPTKCMNCSETRKNGACPNCGLTQDEDIQVHDELRSMVSPQHTLFDASRIANKAGRRLMALKLVTAAATLNEQGLGDDARALRIWLLAAINEQQAAVEDGRAWIESIDKPPTIAWASYGGQLEQASLPGAAADAYSKALKQAPREFVLRARRANLLLGLHREGQALDEACTVLEYGGHEPEAIDIALQVAEKLCDLFEAQYRNDEIDRMLDRSKDHVERSALLLGQRARLAAVNGDTSGAKRDLRKARKLNPELEIYERVERALKPARSSWWRW
jgi:tetratricopeptide (TPR) repeat protein